MPAPDLYEGLDVDAAGNSLAWPGPVDGANPWESLENQIKRFKILQDECKRSFASFAEEQVVHLAAMQRFAHCQAQLYSSSNPHATALPPEDDCQAQLSKINDSHAAVLPTDVDKDSPTVNGAGHQVRPIISWVPRGGAEHSGSAVVQQKSGAVAQQKSGARSRGQSGQEAALDRSVSATATDAVDRGSTVESKSTIPDIGLSGYNNQTTLADLGPHVDPPLPPMRNGLIPWVRAAAGCMLHGRFFEPMMGFIIGLNAINIGWAIDKELRQESADLQETFEVVFLAIFILELGLRFFVNGMRCLKIMANAFDFALVLITTATMVIKPLVSLGGGEDIAQHLQQLMILRMLRLLRLARAVRLIASFRSLWKLVQGLWHSLGTMVSAVMLIFLTMYIFACFGAELIAKQYMYDREVGTVVSAQFSSLPNIILTLFQFVAMDSTAAFYVPLIQRSPWIAIYFLLLLIIVTIALMNLITALLVEDAITSAQMDEEMKGFYIKQRLRQLEPALRELFRELDYSGDGFVQVREIIDAIKHGIHIPRELQDIINPARMVDLFEAIDSDQSGDISEDEWVKGLSCVALADVSLETMQILHLLRIMRKELKRSGEDRRLLAWRGARGHASSSGRADKSHPRPAQPSSGSPHETIGDQTTASKGDLQAPHRAENEKDPAEQASPQAGNEKDLNRVSTTV